MNLGDILGADNILPALNASDRWQAIDELIDSLRRQLGVTSVVVTHDLHSALSIGTRIAMLHGGKIVELSTPAEFIKSEQREVRGFLEAQFITKRGAWERTQP